MYYPIRDYAALGNLRSAVLVSRHGSIDWAPAPFIDSPSVFGALLDDEDGGFWRIAPPEGVAYEAQQRYIPNTNVLVTEFTTDTGSFEVIDFIPIEALDELYSAEEDTTFRIHRKVLCKNGHCDVNIVFAPAFDYARSEVQLSHSRDGIYAEGVHAQRGTWHGTLATKRRCTITGGRAISNFTLEAGESEFFIFRYNCGNVAFARNNPEHLQEQLDDTEQFWREWSAPAEAALTGVDPQWRDEVMRSALMLKVLFFEPVGTVAAAATTSLPEVLGGVRNWDYRFTWLRDSSLIFKAFFRLGYTDEAEEYMQWLLGKLRQSVQDEPGGLQIVYGLRDEVSLEEKILPHLKGYRESQPVRIGNDAYKQRQWDAYGNIFDVIHDLQLQHGAEVLDAESWRALASIADYIADMWREPDEGLWEIRGGSDHYVYSKVMCWVVLDRALKLQEAHEYEGNVARWREEKEKIHSTVMERGYNEALGAFTQSFDSEELDAAALLLSKVGFIDGTDPKMRSTIRTIYEVLGDEAGRGLIRRYTADDGLPGEEGAFLLASFWLVDALFYAGEIQEARSLFHDLVKQANHVQLFSEEIDPASGDFLGNFPQAYTHLGLINSAFILGRTR